jgi:hypothetical protein
MTQNWSFSSIAQLYLDNGKLLRGESWDISSKEGLLHDDVAKPSHSTLVIAADGAIRHCQIFENFRKFRNICIRWMCDYYWTHRRYQAMTLGPWVLGRVFYLVAILKLVYFIGFLYGSAKGTIEPRAAAGGSRQKYR